MSSLNFPARPSEASGVEIGPKGRPPFSWELYAIGRIIGNKCFDENHEYMKCKAKDNAPSACLTEGDEVHRCVYGLFKEITAKAKPEFEALKACLDWNDLRSQDCKKHQHALEKAYYNS